MVVIMIMVDSVAMDLSLGMFFDLNVSQLPDIIDGIFERHAHGLRSLSDGIVGDIFSDAMIVVGFFASAVVAHIKMIRDGH